MSLGGDIMEEIYEQWIGNFLIKLLDIQLEEGMDRLTTDRIIQEFKNYFKK